MAPSRLADAAVALTNSLTSILEIIQKVSNEEAEARTRVNSLKGEVIALTERVNVQQGDLDDLKRSAETDQCELRSLKEQLQFLTQGPTNSEGEPIDVVALEATTKGLDAFLRKEKASADWGLAWKFGHECTVKIVQDLSIKLSLSIDEINQALRHAVHVLDPQKAEVIFPDRQGEYPVNTGNEEGTHPLNQESLQALSTSQHTKRKGTIDNLLCGPSVSRDRPAAPVPKTLGTSALSPYAPSFSPGRTPLGSSQIIQPGMDWISQARGTGIGIGNGPSHVTLPAQTTSTRRLTAWDAKIVAAIMDLRKEIAPKVINNSMTAFSPETQVKATEPVIDLAPTGELQYEGAAANQTSEHVTTAWDKNVEASKQALRQFLSKTSALNLSQGENKKPSVVTDKQKDEPASSSQTVLEGSKLSVLKDAGGNYKSTQGTDQILNTKGSSAVNVQSVRKEKSHIMNDRKQKHKNEKTLIQMLETLSSSAVDIPPVNNSKLSTNNNDLDNQSSIDTQMIANYPKPPLVSGANDDSPTDTDTTVSLITPKYLNVHLALEPFPLINPAAPAETRYAGTIPIRQYEHSFDATANLVAWPSSGLDGRALSSEGRKPTINQDNLAEGFHIDNMKAAMNRFAQQGKYKRGLSTEEHNREDDISGANVKPRTPPNGTHVLGSLLSPLMKVHVLKDPFADYTKLALHNYVEADNETKWEDHGLVWHRNTTSDGNGFWSFGEKRGTQVPS